MITMYLAGPIRANVKYDWMWRQMVIANTREWQESQDLRILNPMAGNFHDTEQNVVYTSGVPITDGHINQQDLWCLQHSDIVLFNFSGLADGYPCIGSLVEWGRAIDQAILRYVIWPKEFTSSESMGVGKIHPFIEQNATEIFPETKHAITFLQRHLPVLLGTHPDYEGAGTTEELQQLWGD